MFEGSFGKQRLHEQNRPNYFYEVPFLSKPEKET